MDVVDRLNSWKETKEKKLEQLKKDSEPVNSIFTKTDKSVDITHM